MEELMREFVEKIKAAEAATGALDKLNKAQQKRDLK
jgi:hypothetical protein